MINNWVKRVHYQIGKGSEYLCVNKVQLERIVCKETTVGIDIIYGHISSWNDRF